jgi:predicted exporter
MKWPRLTLAQTLWLIVLALCIAVIGQTRFVADLSAFMPKMPNQRQQLLVDQLRDGVISRLVMIGIDGADQAERARLSSALAEKLRSNQFFVGVQNGDAATQELDRRYFFNNRYLLSPAVTNERFTVAGIHEALNSSLDAIAGSGGLLLKRLLPRDPTGETLQLLGQFTGNSQPNSVNGVWTSRDGGRALLLVQTRIDGTDTEAQAQSIESIKQSFNQIAGRSADSRLVMSGTSVFSVSARSTIESEVRRLAIMSTIFVVTLLLVVYRSVLLLIVGLLPVASGALVGIAAVSLGFGHVHGLTLGFGTTLIGEAVDYSIYLFVQRAGGENPDAFWRTIRLGVLTSTAGFFALLFSGFPGLSQLGLYSISGLIAAALVTRYLLPSLIPHNVALRDLTPIGDMFDRMVSSASRLRWVIGVLLVAASGSIYLHTGEIWNRQLGALSPISRADMKLDMELRSDLGATDMRYMAAFTAVDEESALQWAERASAVLQDLTKEKVIGGFNSPSMVLPSLASQSARQAAIPDDQKSRQNLKEALMEIPIKIDRLEGFLTDLQVARTRNFVVRSELNGTSAALLLDSLLLKRDNDYLVLMPLRSTGEGPTGEFIDLGKVTATLNAKGLSNVTVIDIFAETTAVFDSYLNEALVLSGLGCLAIVVLLLIALRSVPRTLRVVTPLACAVLCVVAVLLAFGVQLTILHLVGLLLIVAVGSNYAIFFDVGAQQRTDTDRRQTLTSLVVANLTTVGSFGLLGFSKVPVLAAIGTTVGPGAFFALVFSAILAGSNFNASSR